MADINHVTIVGRLTRDAELNYTATGQPVCKFSIAVNRQRKEGDKWVDEASFFDVTLWGKRGESVNQYLLKGKQIGVEGELRQDRWIKEGQNRSKVEIMATNVQLLGGGNKDSQSSPSAQPEKSANASSTASGNSDEGFADEIPF